jgi:hypothetical protein
MTEKNIITLYHLAPAPANDTYIRMMVHYFKWHDFSDILKNANLNYTQINSSQNLNITDKDYIIVSDIRTTKNHDTKYYQDVINLFNINNRAVFLYETMKHINHRWKYQFIKQNFKYIFTNCQKMAKKYEYIYWIPTCNLFLKHETYSKIKNKFCMVSPIFDLGLYYYKINGVLPPRIQIISSFCKKRNNIHVYGNKLWENFIPKSNFCGTLPGENIAGIYGEMTFDNKIKNKCKVMSEYKFILVFENVFTNGYVTEKLVESLYSNSVIIYFGPKNIESIYPKLFDNCVINGHKYTVNQILNIMDKMSESEYNNRVQNMLILREELIINNSSESVKKFVVETIMSIIDKKYIPNKNSSLFSLTYINDIIKN